MSGKTRIGLISNPLSGGNRKGLSSIRTALMGGAPIDHFEAITPLEVGSALDELAGRGVDVVTVNGGDGTIQAVLTRLFGRPASRPIPVLAILRSGTTSLIARDVGLRGSKEQALGRLIAWANTGQGKPEFVKRPVLRVERAADQDPLYGMFFGLAGICQGMRFFHAHLNPKRLGGQIGPGLTIARFLMAAKRGGRALFPVPISVRLDEEPPVKGDFLLILISTLERLFFGLRPYWGEEDGPLYYTAIGGGSRHLPRAFLSLLRGRKSPFLTTENGFFSRNIWEARLALSGEFALDGEFYRLDGGQGQVAVKEGGEALFLQL